MLTDAAQQMLLFALTNSDSTNANLKPQTIAMA
jgi:hypothetical protein